MVPARLRLLALSAFPWLQLVVIGCVCLGTDFSRAEDRPVAPVCVAPLLALEDRLLPAPLVDGPRRHEELLDYYWEANPELKHRLDQALTGFVQPRDVVHRRVTLVAGSAGVGKSFLKRAAFKSAATKDRIFKADLRELFEQWHKDGLTEERSELCAGAVTVNTQMARKPGMRADIGELLAAQASDFFVIDSLDEIHPDDQFAVLSEIERFAFGSNRPFVEVLVLGRSAAMRDYWQARHSQFSREQLSLCVLAPPVLRTTGDLEVSSWNYHCFKYNVQQPLDATGKSGPISLATYRDWSAASFVRTGPFSTVTFDDNANMQPRVSQQLLNWSHQYPLVTSTLGNLAGNGFTREIVEGQVRQSRDYDEAQFMKSYFESWLRRETKAENRPSAGRPEHLDLYEQLLETVAAKYAAADRLSADGTFQVAASDTVAVTVGRERVECSVRNILDRSGCEALDPRRDAGDRYRFEPVWFHRMLVNAHNDRANAR